MGWREFRATLLFVLISLVAGAAYREWRARSDGGAGGATFVERLRSMDEAARLDAERGLDPQGLATGGPSPSPSGGPSLEGGPPDATTEVRRAGRGAASRPVAFGSLDVDRAAPSDWERLPGIGPALAARIVADRATRGPFLAPEGLLRVRGIGPRTLDRIRPFLRSAPVDSASPFAK